MGENLNTLIIAIKTQGTTLSKLSPNNKQNYKDPNQRDHIQRAEPATVNIMWIELWKVGRLNKNKQLMMKK